MDIIKKIFKYMFILFLLTPLVACEEKVIEPQIIPVFTGIDDITIEVGDNFDPREGIIATWNGNDITLNITITGTVDTNVEGVYNLEYRVESEKGDIKTVSRKVTVVAKQITEDPVLPTFSGIDNVRIKQYEGFNPYEGVIATWKGNDITSNITITGTVDITKVGVYTLEYRVESENGDVATRNRQVTVLEKVSNRFTENESVSTNLNNVTHVKAKGNVINDSNTSAYQDINVLMQGKDVLVASWCKFTNGKYVLSPTLDIAKDFELNNPNYEVIAAINGDFFYAQSGISYNVGPNILFGNRVVKPDSFYAGYYYSVQFNQYGEKLGVHKTLTFSNNINLTLYDENGALIYYNNQVLLDKTTLNDNQTSIIFNKSYTYDSNATYFVLNQKNKYTLGSHTYFEADVSNRISSSNSTAIVLVTKDPVLKNLLNSNQRIIIQTMTNGIGYNDMVIGIDAPIIENSIVRKFNELNTATTEQVSRNKGRNPRTGFGYDKAGNMVLITVDGRGVSNGVDLREFGYIMDYYGIVEGYNLDGGGSTQAVFRVDGELKYVNKPSETYRGVGNAILFIREKVKKPSHNFEIKNGKIHLTILDKADISEIDILINGKSNKYTDLNKEIVLELTDPKTTAIAINYTKNNVTYHLLNEIFGGVRRQVNINNQATFDYDEGYSFEQNIGFNNKIFVFNYEQWKSISNIVDSPSYDKDNSVYKMANLSLAVTDASGKVVALRLYQKWISHDGQPGIQLTTDVEGNIVVNKADAFDRNNVEIGVMDLLPEGGLVYVFATPTPNEDDGFSVAMKFAYEHLLGLKPSLLNTAYLLNCNEEFTDWTNPPINPFAEDFKLTITAQKAGAEENKQLHIKIGQEEHIAELDNYGWDAVGGVGSISTHALVFSKEYLATLPGYKNAQTPSAEGKNYVIKYSILAITDKNGKILEIRTHPGHKLTWNTTERKINVDKTLDTENMQIGLYDAIPNDGFVVLFQNSTAPNNAIRAWGCKQLTGYVDVTAYANETTGGVTNMTVNPFAEGFIIEFIYK